MLDINYIRQNPEEVQEMLQKRLLSSETPKVSRLLELDRQRRELVQKSDDLKALRNSVSKEIADIKKSRTGSADELIVKMKSVSDEITGMDSTL
ncbi:MAG: serine--tRNA ligase, partial [Chlorobiaceae bacterium]|nr:serine--tRNA ligase [Chlorobiaceae bacterium]